MSEVGKTAPDFKLRAHDGSEVSLQSFRDKKWVVISAYPFAFTGGWTNQTASFNRVLKQFEEKQAQILGLSCDPATGLKVWAAALGGISYPLMSDFHPHGAVSTGLGIFNAEGGFTKRAVIIIDPKGVIRLMHVHPPGVLPVPAEVLNELSGLQGT